MEIKDVKRRKAVKEVLKVIGVRADIDEIRKLEGKEERSGKMLLLKLEGEEQKRESMRRKREKYGRFDLEREKDEMEARRDS